MNSKKKEHNWLLNKKIIENDFLCSRQDSNLDLEFRKLLFYPLNYGS
jgi:predicted oxidoreductase